jgi:hypothetical protein
VKFLIFRGSLLALKSQDNSLSEVIDRLRVEKGERGKIRSRDKCLTKIIFDLPERVQSKIGESLQTILVTHTSNNWLEMYGKLLEFIKSAGHPSPPRNHELLGNWVSKQRHDYSINKLKSRNVSLLESIPGWTWDQRDSNWQEMYHELCDYAKNTGTVNLYGSSNPILSNWVSHQRRFNKQSSLSKERIELLESIKGWTWDEQESKWSKKFQELCDYTTETGSATPPRNHKSLGTWISNQRKHYNNNTLLDTRINLLEGLNGWTWNKLTSQWHTMHKELLKYYKECGHAHLPPLPRSLKQWESRQKELYSIDKLSNEQIYLLESLNGWMWNAKT